MFKNIKDRVNNRFGNGTTETANPSADGGEEVEEVQDDVEDAKEERRLSFLLEKARRAYIEKGLSGSIEITKSFGVIYRTVSCDIDGVAERASTEGTVEEEVEEDEKMSRLQKLAVSGIARCIKALEKRANNYRNKSYKSSLTLTSTLYVTAPLFGLMSINISCSASVDSLLAPK